MMFKCFKFIRLKDDKNKNYQNIFEKKEKKGKKKERRRRRRKNADRTVM